MLSNFVLMTCCLVICASVVMRSRLCLYKIFFVFKFCFVVAI